MKELENHHIMIPAMQMLSWGAAALGGHTDDADNISKGISHGNLYRSQNIFADITLKSTMIPVLGSSIAILIIMI